MDGAYIASVEVESEREEKTARRSGNSVARVAEWENRGFPMAPTARGFDSQTKHPRSGGLPVAICEHGFTDSLGLLPRVGVLRVEFFEGCAPLHR